MATPFKDLLPKEVAEQVKKPGVVLFDVRTPQEFASAHYDGAVNVPIKLEGPEGRIANPDFEKEVQAALAGHEGGVVCTCGGGSRGGAAAGKLVDMGFKEVANMVGGMGAWVKEGLPVVGEDKAPGKL